MVSCIVYFISDDRKAGGKYVTKIDSVKMFDKFKGIYLLEDKCEIPINHLFLM